MSDADDRRYGTLVKVLDGLCKEAPASLNLYRARDQQGLIQARSRAFIHLYLKAKFGLIDFEERELLITDGAHDGGVDAYFIDRAARTIYIVQSKFRATSSNFKSNNMSAEDLVRMEVRRILEGERKSELGVRYNDKIVKFQSAIRKIPDGGSFSHSVVVLGNFKNFTQQQIRRLIGDYVVDQYDYMRSYKELLFPVINGSYYNDPNLVIQIQRQGINSDSHLDYDVKISEVGVNVKLLYVPTQEIARVMHVYKNSLLKYNPRSFLEVSKNPVNKEIVDSVKRDRGNEFSLFNNGITIVSDETTLSTNTGKKGLTLLTLKVPQLINGAQTAYSLSLSHARGNVLHLKGKEVLLRVITFRRSKSLDRLKKEQLISRISKASNLQTKVDEADRRSNDPLQMKLQSILFEEYGWYYERKRGEFAEGLRDGYIDKSLLVNREKLMRVALAGRGEASQARSSVAKYFKKEEFEKTLKVGDVDKYAFGYEIFLSLRRRLARARDSSRRYRVGEYGYALRYGNYAVVSVCINKFMRSSRGNPEVAIDMALGQWKDFEKWVKARSENGEYVKRGAFDAVNYCKGQTLNRNLAAYRFK